MDEAVGGGVGGLGRGSVGLGERGVEGGSGDLKVVGAARAVKRHDVSLLSLLTSEYL